MLYGRTKNLSGFFWRQSNIDKGEEGEKNSPVLRDFSRFRTFRGARLISFVQDLSIQLKVHYSHWSISGSFFFHFRDRDPVNLRDLPVLYIFRRVCAILRILQQVQSSTSTWTLRKKTQVSWSRPSLSMVPLASSSTPSPSPSNFMDQGFTMIQRAVSWTRCLEWYFQ